MQKKLATSIRFGPRAKLLLERLTSKLNLSQTAVIELAIQELAKKWGITIN